MPHDEYVAWQRDCLSAMLRVLSEDGAIFYNHKWRVQGGLLQDRADIVSGFPVSPDHHLAAQRWHQFQPGYFLPTYEVIYSDRQACNFKLGAESQCIKGDVWRIKQEIQEQSPPGAFPPGARAEMHRLYYEAEDRTRSIHRFGHNCHCGRDRLAGQWIGIDISPETYCELARQRINDVMGRRCS